jgi:hypothetical protein
MFLNVVLLGLMSPLGLMGSSLCPPVKDKVTGKITHPCFEKSKVKPVKTTQVTCMAMTPNCLKGKDKPLLGTILPSHEKSEKWKADIERLKTAMGHIEWNKFHKTLPTGGPTDPTKAPCTGTNCNSPKTPTLPEQTKNPGVKPPPTCTGKDCNRRIFVKPVKPQPPIATTPDKKAQQQQQQIEKQVSQLQNQLNQVVQCITKVSKL